jgi:hypothetical protein
MANASSSSNHKDRLGVTAVAVRLRKRYHKARDLMLTGQLGEAAYDEKRRLTVPVAGVAAYERKQAGRKP